MTDTLSMPVLLRASGSSKSGELLTLSDLTALAIAPPHAVPERESMAGPDSNEEQSTSSSSSSSSSESVIGDSFTFSSLSSTGQLTPPTTDIADHRRDIDIEQNINKHVIQDDDVDERVQLSPSSSLKGKSRSRQSTARRCAESEHVAVPRSEVRRYAAEIVRKEAKALLDLAARLDAEPDDVLHPQHEQVPRLKPEQTQDAYTRAVEILKSMDSHGRIIMTGVGKSGLLARKAVATFNSFGIPSAFLHPVEALHGDLGLLSPYGIDTVILISYSGRTTELLHLLHHLRQRRVHGCISLSSPDSRLAEACDVNIDVSLENDEEAEDSVPAPTSSVVTALAALDALALTLLRFKTGWHSHISERRKAFGLHHPGGSLGQQLSSTLEQT